MPTESDRRRHVVDVTRGEHEDIMHRVLVLEEWRSSHNIEPRLKAVEERQVSLWTAYISGRAIGRLIFVIGGFATGLAVVAATIHGFLIGHTLGDIQ